MMSLSNVERNANDTYLRLGPQTLPRSPPAAPSTHRIQIRHEGSRRQPRSCISTPIVLNALRSCRHAQSHRTARGNHPMGVRGRYQDGEISPWVSEIEALQRAKNISPLTARYIPRATEPIRLIHARTPYPTRAHYSPPRTKVLHFYPIGTQVARSKEVARGKEVARVSLS